MSFPIQYEFDDTISSALEAVVEQHLYTLTEGIPDIEGAVVAIRQDNLYEVEIILYFTNGELYTSKKSNSPQAALKLAMYGLESQL